MKTMVIIVFALAALIANGQSYDDGHIDSLKSAIEYSEGLGKYEPMVAALRYYWNRDSIEQAFELAERARGIAAAYGDTLKYVDASRMMGRVLAALGKNDEMLSVVNDAMPIAKRNGMKKEYSAMLTLMGSEYVYRAQYDLALQYFFESLSVKREMADTLGESLVINNIGVVHYKLRNYRGAFEYFQRSLELKKELRDKQDSDIALINIGHCYAYLGLADSALSFVDDGLAFCGDSCSTNVMVMAQYVYGLVSFNSNNLEAANSWFLKSYDLARERGDTRFQLDNLIYLSRIALMRGQTVIAEEYLNAAEALIDEGATLNGEIIKINKGFSELYLMKRDFQRAAAYQKRYIRWRDSLYNTDLTNNLMAIHAEFLHRENEIKLKSQATMLNLNNRLIVGQRWLGALIFCLAAVVLIIVVAIWRRYTNRRRMTFLLRQRVRERTIELERAITLHRSFLQEQERRLENVKVEVQSGLADVVQVCSLGTETLRDENMAEYFRQVRRISRGLLSHFSFLLLTRNGMSSARTRQAEAETFRSDV